MNQKKMLGSQGEKTALDYLQGLGFRWRGSNVRTKWGEIDLVMEDGSTLVFVEVKTRDQDDQYGCPEEAITPGKMRHMVNSALSYLVATKWEDRSIRFDVVTLSPAGLRHYRDAIQYEGEVYL